MLRTWKSWAGLVPVLAPAVGVLAAAAAPIWPQFRGPSGNGVAPADSNPPLTWSETNNLAWKVPIPGRGRSSPVLLGNRLWLTTALERGVVRTRMGPDDMQTAEHVSLKALALDASTGRILWETMLFDVEHPDPVHWHNSWATPTPVAEPGRLYCDFGTFGTACLDADTGAVLWRQRVPVNHQVGPGSSPAVFHDLLMLVRDGRDAQFVTALDKTTGKVVWKTPRPPFQTSSPDLRKSFSSPILVQVTGRTQMIIPGPHWLVSYDPLTGGEIWRVKHGPGFSIGACPVFGQGMVFFSTGCMKPQLWAVRAEGAAGDVTETNIVWKSLRQVPVMSSPLLVGAELYWVSDEGMATCADAPTGTIHWQERLGELHLASPLFAAGRLYFFARTGRTTVLKAGKQFERLSENTLEGTLIATPALAGKTIFLRTDTHLYRIAQP